MLSVASCLFLAGGLLLLVWHTWSCLRQRRQAVGNLPPGPPGWPFVGNLDILASDQRHQKIFEAGRRYGGLFTIKLGAVRSVWITSYKHFREATLDHTWDFAGRPHGVWMVDDTTDQYPGILTGGVDESGRNVRRFTTTCLRSFGFGKTSMQDTILQECKDLNEEFRKQNGQPFNPRNAIAHAAANIIASITLGQTFKQGDEGLKLVNESLTDGVKQVINAQRDRIFPILRYVPLNSRKILYESFQNGKRFLSNIVNEHTATRDATDPRDFIDAWLNESQRRNEFSLKQLPNVLLDLFSGGYETTTTTIQWLFAMLLHHPEVQEKIHAELDHKLGRGQIKIEDQDSIPYTQAVIFETLRLYPPAPFAVPHMATENATLGGFLLPKGTRLMFHLYSIHHDPELWVDAEVFRPERFLLNDEVRTPEFFVPFGAGRRSCIGEQLGRKELFLLFANVLQNFQIVKPAGADLPLLDLMQGAVMHPRPFEVVLKER